MNKKHKPSIPGISEEMASWHRENLTFPHTIVEQCEAMRNHAAIEGCLKDRDSLTNRDKNE